ncbi:MAG: hypothetical protein R6U32_04070 [Candidatus Woesearchaeota archaeon]
MKLYDLLLRSSSGFLKEQKSDGSFPPGHNGPWNDPETPMRNTAHIAMLLHKAYRISGEKKYRDAAVKACDFLLMKKNRPHGYNFHCRKKSMKADPVNGTIGPAWAIEPLIFIGKDLKKKEYLDLAEEIVSMHRFSKKRKLWHIKNLDGSDGRINETFNQQLWFGAMAITIARIRKNKKLLDEASSFFSNLPDIVTFIEPGLIEHTLRRDRAGYRMKRILISMIEQAKGNQDFTRRRSRGYLAFNTYGFAIAYDNNRSLSLWKDKRLRTLIRKPLEYLRKNYPMDLRSGKGSFSWAYNPTGIETAYSLQALAGYSGLKIKKKELDKEIANWVSDQIKHYYSTRTGFMERNTTDSRVLSARLYEAVRLENIKVDA